MRIEDGFFILPFDPGTDVSVNTSNRKIRYTFNGRTTEQTIHSDYDLNRALIQESEIKVPRAESQSGGYKQLLHD